MQDHSSGKHTHEVTILVLGHASLLHGLVEHLCLRLADKSIGAIVAVGHAFEKIVNTQEPDYSLAVIDICISEQPQADFAGVNVLDELAQLWIRLDDVVQG